MKYALVVLFFWFVSCQTQDQRQESGNTTSEYDQTEASQTKAYPQALEQVLAQHGGVDAWRSKKRLSFEIVKEEGNEKHYVQLDDRRDRVEGSNFTMGFNGENVWVDADTTYNGNPEFYHNLMFYFYAMPFVLADDGIIYDEVEPLEFQGVSYPGLGISYEQGIGTSSKDQYFIYYHPETLQMAWLGYTVTFFSNETSDDIHWIQYTDWGDFNGLKLPSAITWYNYEDGLPTEPRNRVEFANVRLDSQPYPDEMFMQP